MQSPTADFAPGAATRRTGRNIRVVFNSGPCASLCENMTSFRKPEALNMLHCGQMRTEPRSQVTCTTENLVKFGRVFLEICQRTDRQTYRHADHNTSHPYRGQSNFERAVWEMTFDHLFRFRGRGCCFTVTIRAHKQTADLQ